MTELQVKNSESDNSKCQVSPWAFWFPRDGDKVPFKEITEALALMELCWIKCSFFSLTPWPSSVFVVKVPTHKEITVVERKCAFLSIVHWNVNYQEVSAGDWSRKKWKGLKKVMIVNKIIYYLVVFMSWVLVVTYVGVYKCLIRYSSDVKVLVGLNKHCCWLMGNSRKLISSQ